VDYFITCSDGLEPIGRDSFTCDTDYDHEDAQSKDLFVLGEVWGSGGKYVQSRHKTTFL